MHCLFSSGVLPIFCTDQLNNVDGTEKMHRRRQNGSATHPQQSASRPTATPRPKVVESTAQLQLDAWNTTSHRRRNKILKAFDLPGISWHILAYPGISWPPCSPGPASLTVVVWRLCRQSASVHRLLKNIKTWKITMGTTMRTMKSKGC